MGRDDVVRNFSPEHPEKVLCVASRRQTLIYAYLPVRGQERAATADLSGLNSSWTRAVDTDNTDGNIPSLLGFCLCPLMWYNSSRRNRDREEGRPATKKPHGTLPL
ncbi:hypothetical protein TEQG_01255 [Trichophyton equinum CBS 127.97]|uniref:Uncharacterized protein n=1 Tax=Trichophyton equinum (strain ATCC MYA-4606 / CBS 127.97) TaxID=559882 RepID=F2PJZ6_TRIEC|nr:hypothetical protein TEQG_01255 [Trichophyton equinum CBS 127.97]